MSSTQQSNPWFGLSMALAGVIVGYGVAMATGGGVVPAQVAPTPEAKPTPTPAPSQPTAAAPSYDNLIAFNEDDDYYKGNPDAKITIIEYSDYECPFCQRHHPTIQQAVDEYGDDVVWIYRHYPLSFHSNAKPAAEAAECVGELAGNEKFWEFTDMVYERGSEIAKLAGYIAEIGVDKAAFDGCMESAKYSEKVDQQLADGTKAGVRGTPGTFVTNTETGETEYISGAQPYTNLKAAIDRLM